MFRSRLAWSRTITVQDTDNSFARPMNAKERRRMLIVAWLSLDRVRARHWLVARGIQRK